MVYRPALGSTVKAIPHLNDGASVILNTSAAASKGAANMGIYAATKAAVRSFARTAATELLARRIRVNVVAFLASDEASYITGVELHVDGGMANL